MAAQVERVQIVARAVLNCADSEGDLGAIERTLAYLEVDTNSLVFTHKEPGEITPGQEIIAADVNTFFHPEAVQGSFIHPLDEASLKASRTLREPVVYAYPAGAFSKGSIVEASYFQVRSVPTPVVELHLVY